jgi:ubiquinol-cytochrome c reductase cytochrome c1 subunit
MEVVMMKMLRPVLNGSMLKGAIAALAVATATLIAPAAHAAGDRIIPPRSAWSFSGPFGTFDQGQLQRGFKVYREVCASCHSISLLRFRNLAQAGGPGFTAAQVASLAAEYKIKDGPNDQGEMFERAGRAADAFPAPFPNEQAARAAMNGAYPPDMSVLAKARTYERGLPWFIFDIFTQYQEQGPDYIAALLKGYKDAPKGFPELQPGQYYNTYMPGHLIAMPQPMQDGQVEYPKGADGKPVAPETLAQYSYDVTAFMMWAAEPHLNARKQTGMLVMLFLVLLAGLTYFTKKKIWSRLPEHAAAH